MENVATWWQDVHAHATTQKVALVDSPTTPSGDCPRSSPQWSWTTRSSRQSARVTGCRSSFSWQLSCSRSTRRKSRAWWSRPRSMREPGWRGLSRPPPSSLIYGSHVTSMPLVQLNEARLIPRNIGGRKRTIAAWTLTSMLGDAGSRRGATSAVTMCVGPPRVTPQGIRLGRALCERRALPQVRTHTTVGARVDGVWQCWTQTCRSWRSCTARSLPFTSMSFWQRAQSSRGTCGTPAREEVPFTRTP